MSRKIAKNKVEKQRKKKTENTDLTWFGQYDLHLQAKRNTYYSSGKVFNYSTW